MANQMTDNITNGQSEDRQHYCWPIRRQITLLLTNQRTDNITFGQSEDSITFLWGVTTGWVLLV